MSSFLPSLEDTLVDLLLHGDTGALRVTEEERSWTFYVQGGVLVGVELAPPRDDLEGTELAAVAMTEVMALRTPIWEFEEGAGPDSFGLYDARHALGRAVGAHKRTDQLLRALEPVLDAWPELLVDPYTLSDVPEVQAWLATMDGLGPGIDRIRTAPAPAATSMATLWVAWKLGDVDLHGGEVVDEDEDGDEDGSDADVAVPGPPLGSETPPRTEEAELEEGTAQTAPAGPAPGSRPREASSAAISAVLKDPFIAGVATARAGNVGDALPLLEEAWAEDPDRPGLEEWLAYTRFSVARDTDATAARAALADLREVMYRTNTGDVAPILPWVLMARAQLERNDIVQARSVLNHVLEREPDDPEAMDLDARLERMEAEQEARRARGGRPSTVRVVTLLAGVAVVAGLAVLVQYLSWQPDPPRVDHAPAFADVVALRELHHIDQDWFAVLPPGVTVTGDEAREICGALRAAAVDDPRGTLTLLDDAGVVRWECGARLD